MVASTLKHTAQIMVNTTCNSMEKRQHQKTETAIMICHLLEAYNPCQSKYISSWKAESAH
jgi:hypothetical protein